MKWYIRTCSMLVLLLFVMVGCNENQQEAKNSHTSSNNTAGSQEEQSALISLETFQQRNYEQILDIREESQYIGWSEKGKLGGHIEKAMDFPVSWLVNKEISINIDNEIDRRHLTKSKPTVLYSDNTVTEEELQYYKKAGFTDLKILDGGFNAYVKAGGKVEKLPGYTMYVSPQWVQDLIDGKQPESYENHKYIIAELDFSKKDYLSGHIKGAISIDSDKFNDVPGLRYVKEFENVPIEEQRKFFDFPTDETIKQNLADYGITYDTTVILYASKDATTGANRTVHILDYAGVKDIRLINGGLPLWKLEGRELSTDDVIPVPAPDFGVSIPQNKSVYITYDQERKLVDDNNAVIASIRSWDEYLGKKSGYTYIAEAGDIKNSRFGYAGTDPYKMQDYRNPDNTLFNYKIIEERWKLWGITPDKYVSFHCGTGWRASEIYYIAKALGWKNIGVYVGGWYLWTKMPDSPLKAPGLPDDAPEQKPQEYDD